MKIEGYLKQFEVLSNYQRWINEEIINFSLKLLEFEYKIVLQKEDMISDKLELQFLSSVYGQINSELYINNF